MSTLMCLPSVIPENEKSLKTLSTPILGIENYPFVTETGLHLICMELLRIQSMLKSKLLA